MANLDSFNSGLYTKFGNGKGVDQVYEVLELADGKILIGGTFLEVNGFPASGIARLNADGSFDHTFHSGFSSASNVRALVELPSGKLLVGGSFNDYDGSPCGNFVVLNPNGTRDLTYTGAGAVGSSPEINDIQLAAGNRVIVAGYFSSFNGVTRNGLVRLTNTLQVDTSFGTNYSGSSVGEFYTVLTFPDGGVLVGGDFENYWGNSSGGLVKLTANGSYDPNFNLYTPGGFNKSINKLRFTADGKILMCGRFSSYGGHPSECIVRLNANGSVDNSFLNSMDMQNSSLIDCNDFNGHVIVLGGVDVPNSSSMAYLDNNGVLLSGISEMLQCDVNEPVYVVERISDGSFVIGGTFLRIMNRYSSGLFKFSDINVIDKDFFTPPASHNQSGWYGNGHVMGVKKYSGSQYMVSGSFTEFNGEKINGLARLNYDGAVDLTFNANFPDDVRINTFEIQPDGKILVNYQSFIQNNLSLIRLLPNGAVDTSFSCNLHYPVYKILVKSNGKIIIAGDNQSWPDRAVNRLESNGAPDPSFTPFTPPGGNDVYSVIELPNGKILVASRWGGVTRITSSGVEDPTYSYNSFSFSTTITGFATQSDGKIVFSAPGGNRIFRLNANGTTDATYMSQYNAVANNQEPSAMELQEDDKLLVCGNQHVYRFNVDGSLDTTFKEITITNGRIYDFLLDSTRLLLGGDYEEVNGIPINDLVGVDYSNNNTVGLDEFNNSKNTDLFRVYPNPIISGQKISWKSEEQIESIAIYSMEGRLLQQMNVPYGEKAADITVAPGSYIIHANIGSGKYKVAKLMVHF